MFTDQSSFLLTFINADILLTQKQINRRDVTFMNNLNLLNDSLQHTMESKFYTVESYSLLLFFSLWCFCVSLFLYRNTCSFAFWLRWRRTGKEGEVQWLRRRGLHAWQDTWYKPYIVTSLMFKTEQIFEISSRSGSPHGATYSISNHHSLVKHNRYKIHLNRLEKQFKVGLFSQQTVVLSVSVHL